MRRVLPAKSLAAIALTLWSCAEIAGVGGDYRLAPGEAGSANAPNAGAGPASSAGGTAPGSEGTEPSGGDGARTDSTQATGGVSGTGVAGRSAGATSATSDGGASNAVGSAGGDGEVGGSGEPRVDVAGPVRVGFSEFHDSAWGSDNASGHLADATFSKPAGTRSGDLLLVFFGADHRLIHVSRSELDARGWTLIDQHEDLGVDGQATYLLYRFANAVEPDSIVLPEINGAPDGYGVQGLLSVYRGVSKTAPINDYRAVPLATGTKDATEEVTPTPSITTTVDHCLLIAGLSPDSAIDAPVVTMWPTGFTENRVSVVNPPNPYPYGWANIYSAEQHQQAAGTVAESSFTWKFVNATYDTGSLSFIVALAPE